MTQLCPSPSTVNQGQDEATERTPKERQKMFFHETRKRIHKFLPSHYNKAPDFMIHIWFST